MICTHIHIFLLDEIQVLILGDTVRFDECINYSLGYLSG